MDASGNIKLFGAKITLKGQGGVTFDGDVQYETGAGNEPEGAGTPAIPEIPVTATLELDAQSAEQSPALNARWLDPVIRSGDTVALEVSYQSLADGNDLTVTVAQEDPDGQLHTIDEFTHSPNESTGLDTLN